MTMDYKEKVSWAYSLLGMWGGGLTGIALAFYTEEATLEGLKSVVGFLSFLTVVYVLILSWRLAYLKGRNS